MDDEKKQMELIKRVASVMGHELRNPLAVINNSAYFLKTKLSQGAKLDPKVEKHLGILTSEIARADKMIGDMVAYSRPIDVKSAAVSLGDLVEAQVAALAIPDSVKVEKKLAKTVEVSGDEKLLSDAVRRLLDNAVEALLNGGTITVSVYAEKGFGVVEVRDTGPGIKPEVLAELFGPFRTGKPRGMGLGLALTRKIAEAHKGKAEGGNLKEGGARFRLLVPAA